jgi:hypothetical protein
LCLVRRDFAAGGVTRRPGEVVDVTDYTNSAGLLTTGYLLPYNGATVEQAGRMWRDEETAQRFAPIKRARKTVRS